MSWKMTKEVREARYAGQLPGIKGKSAPTTFLVLLLMADTCRGESRVASISVTELVTLTGVDRTAVWRAITKLGDLGYAKQLGRSNQYQSAKFEVLPGARCTDATCTESDARCTDATCTEEVHVADDEVHVADEQVHVADEASARCSGATYPSIPDIYPDTDSRGEERGPTREVALRDDPPSPTQSANQLTQEEPPPLFCPKHRPDGPQGESCPGCGDQRRICDRWQKTPGGIEYRRRHHVVDAVIRDNTKDASRQLQSDMLRAKYGGRVGRTFEDIMNEFNDRRPLAGADRKALGQSAVDAEVVDEP